MGSGWIKKFLERVQKTENIQHNMIVAKMFKSNTNEHILEFLPHSSLWFK